MAKDLVESRSQNNWLQGQFKQERQDMEYKIREQD